MKPSKLLPTVETLEAREVPAAFGTPWPNADKLTLSFAPDGTQIPVANATATSFAPYQSELFAELGTGSAAPAWQREVLRAFQTWAAQTNINIGLVADSGETFGNNGLTENAVLAAYGARTPGATTYGDIRVGALQQPTGVIAISEPYSLVGGTNSGDFLLNRAHAFSLGGSTGTKDLFSIALHEAGNILGLSDSANSAEVMYGSYNGVRIAPTAADVTRLQALYGGPRKPDALEGSKGNNATSTATALSILSSSLDATKKYVEANADITTATDQDYYKFVTPSGTSNFTVRLNTQGRSLFTGRLEVRDSAGVILQSAVRTDPLQGDLVLTLSGTSVKANTTYYVRVSQGTTGVFGIGSYQMRVGFNFDPQSLPSSSTSPVTVLPDDGGANDKIGTPTVLKARSDGPANGRYTARAEIETSNDRDHYRVTAPTTLVSGAAMSVTVRPLQSFQLFAGATVFNAAGTPVATETLVEREDGRIVLQVPNPQAGATYYVKVWGKGKGGNYLTGEYILDVNFNQARLALQAAASGTLSSSHAQEHKTLIVPETWIYHFVLGAGAASNVDPVKIRMTIYDPSGNAFFSRVAEAGLSVSGAVLLSGGQYTIRFTAVTQSGAAPPSITYGLTGLVLSDPIDPYEADPNSTPTTSEVETVTLLENYYTSLGLTDPFGDPWAP